MRNKLKDGGLYLFGNLFDKAIAFITVPIFTRLMTTTEYGLSSTYSSYVGILSVIISLSLANSIRNAYVDYKDVLNKYISSVFTLGFINFCVISAILVFANMKFAVVEKYFLMFCLIQSFNSFFVNSMIVKFMIQENAKKRTILQVLPNFMATLLSVILLLNMNEHKEYGRIIPMCLTVSVFGCCIFLFYLLKEHEYINLKYWKYALSISIPLIFHGLSVNILSSSDRMLLTLLREAAETGVYSVVYNFGMISTVITTSLEGVWIPFFTKKMLKADKESVNNYARVYIELCTVFFCGLMIISPEVLVIFASKKYESGVYLIIPIVLATYFQFLYTLSVNAEFYYKKTKIIAVNTVIAAGINFGLNIMFIPHFGALAAAATTVIAYLVSFIFHYLYCKRIDRELFPARMFLLPVCTVLGFTVFQYITMDYVILRWIFGILFLFAYLLCMYWKERSLFHYLLK